MKQGSINRKKIECLFTELKGLTLQDKLAYRAVLDLEKLYLSHMSCNKTYSSEEDRGEEVLKIVKAMMHVKYFVSVYGHLEKYLVPVRDLFQRFLDDV